VSSAATAIAALNRRFLLDHPAEAAQAMERMAPGEAAGLLAQHPLAVLLSVWPYLLADVAERTFEGLPERLQRGLLAELDPAPAASLLSRMGGDVRERCLGLLAPAVRQELEALLRYPPGAAGQLMDPRAPAFRRGLTVAEAEARLRAQKLRSLRELYLVDEGGRLEGRVELQDLVVADPGQALDALARPLLAAVQDLAPREEVVEKLEKYQLTSLPVLDVSGRLLGVIHHEGLVSALAQEASLDIQTMVGASRDERALSSASFAVRKRLGWLHVNLLTAFLAASVVGLFEGTIARFTALAVLLPVVAGQSGNAGAQALAVTMRGLTLREIGARHWLRVVWKEVQTGFLNGVAISITTGAGVWVWSRSFGLSLVIGSAMVIAMVAAGLAGAIIPILLTRVGQDPAQSSSIILTTVTDVVGFFAFLGIATLLSSLL
jgi:magnesium transporter